MKFILLVILVLAHFCDAQKAKSLDDAARKVCLSEHNRYRQTLAEGKSKTGSGQTLPKATNMNKMKYGVDLEKEAVKWAETCKTRTHTPGINYGQNLCWFMPGEDQSEAMKKCTKMWWDEIEKYPGKEVILTSDVFGSGVGHFTQMAQAKNTMVGCATNICRGGPFVVCNYDVQNMSDEPIYNTGETCSACENGRKCSSSLCSTCVKKSNKLSKVAKKH